MSQCKNLQFPTEFFSMEEEYILFQEKMKQNSE